MNPIKRMMSNLLFASCIVEIITDTNVCCITKFQFSSHKMYRGIDVLTLNRILRDIKQSPDKVTINIRGVNY